MSTLFTSYGTAHTLQHIWYSTYGTAHTLQHIRYSTYGTAHTVHHTRYITYATAHTVHHIRYSTVHIVSVVCTQYLCCNICMCKPVKTGTLFGHFLDWVFETFLKLSPVHLVQKSNVLHNSNVWSMDLIFRAFFSSNTD